MSVLIWVTLLFAVRGTDAETDLIQKPTVVVPPLTEGQQATLTCTAPGCCSGSVPEITWMWRGPGQNDSHIIENSNEFRTETPSASVQIHNSTLTFSASAAQHGAQVTCKVSFLKNITTEETVTLSVTYAKKLELTGTTTVRIGEGLNLTCSLESFPPASVLWTKADKKLQSATATVQQSNTVNVFLTISAVKVEHAGEYTCTATHLNRSLTDSKNVTVLYSKEARISGQRTVEQGDRLDLTCIVDSFPPYLITWTKLSDQNLSISLHNDTGKARLVRANMTAEDSGRYICTANHLNHTMTKEVNVTVIDVKTKNISGNTSLEEDGTLNLTCTVESVPRMNVTWTKVPSSKNMHQESLVVQNDTVAARLLITNVTAEHSGQYVCTATHLDLTLTIQANVTLHPKILDTSGCRRKSEILTCECVSRGFPVPVIKWPQLENRTEYSVLTIISSHTVKSSITVAVGNQSVDAVECVSSNGNQEAKMNLTVRKTEEKDSWMNLFLNMDPWLNIIIAFFTGALLSAAFCCCIGKCTRKKQKAYGGLPETLEMMPSHVESLIDAGPAVEDDLAIYQEAAEAKGDKEQAAEQEEAEAQAGEARAAEQGAGAAEAGLSDTDYIDLDFSLMKGPSSGTVELQQTPETEYAEIKKEKVEQDGEGKEEEEILAEGEKPELCAATEEEGDEATALYSTVMKEI